MEWRLAKLARHPSIYKISPSNVCSATKKSYYVYILLKKSKVIAKIIYNETYKDNDRFWFGFVLFIFSFLQLNLFGKATSKCKNEVSSTFIRNSIFFIIYN